MIDANDNYRNQVKDRYEFSSWAGRTKDGDARVSGFNVPSDAIRGLELIEREELPPSGRQRRITRYVYSSSSEGGGQRQVVTVFECDSPADAHETLIDVVMTYMAPGLPRCETKELSVGDICFCGHGDMNSSVIFARSNVLVEIKNASSPPAPVDELAKNFDALILTRLRAS